MLPHQERVVSEKKELDEKLKKLNEFIDKSPLWNKVDELEQTLLLRNQRAVMVQYSTILDQRIALWKTP